MFINTIGYYQLRRLDSTGKLTFHIQKKGTACITSEDKVYLCPKFAQDLINSKEVLEFDNGSFYSPTPEERIGAVMAHEVGHMMKGHLNRNKDLINDGLMAFFTVCANVCGIAAYVFCLLSIMSVSKTSLRPNIKLLIAAISLIGLAIILGLGALYAFIRGKIAHREREHEADLYGMDRLKEIGDRPEAMLWLHKAFIAMSSKYKEKKDPDHNLWNKVCYLFKATHPHPRHRYNRCLAHLNHYNLE